MADSSALNCVNIENSKEQVLLEIDNSVNELRANFEKNRELANWENADNLLVSFESWLKGLDYQEVLLNENLTRDLFLQWVRINYILAPFVKKTKDPKLLWDGFYRPFLYGDYSFYNSQPDLRPVNLRIEGSPGWRFTWLEEGSGWFSLDVTRHLIEFFWKDLNLKPEWGWQGQYTAERDWTISSIPGITGRDLQLGMAEPKKAKQYVSTSKQACVRKWETVRFQQIPKDALDAAKQLPGVDTLGDIMLIVGVGLGVAVLGGILIRTALRD